ncbi:ion channel protein [Arthrobacter sp. TMS1-12-1]
MADTGTHGGPTVRMQLRLAGPAVVAGVVSALGLFAVDRVALAGEHLLWSSLPAAWGVDPASGWWILGILTLTGLLVGLVVQFVPGHGGRDSATTELIAPPLALAAVPGLVLATVLTLAGGVSLGPEIPIIAMNTAILAALVARWWPRVPVDLVVMMGASGTLGALFGSPVAAALVFTGIVAGRRDGGALWDRLFVPLAAAAAGAVTMRWLAGPQLPEGGFAPLGGPDGTALLTGLAVAVAGTLVGLTAVYVFPHVHRFFHDLRHPVLYTTLGGLLLGLLGALGGPITLFKGAHQMGELLRNTADHQLPQLALILAVKLTALLVAASAGFRGGRIFPAVFLGTVVGLVGSIVMPEMPLGLAVACGILGVVLPVARDGWIAMLIAVVVVGDTSVLILLTLIVLPLWLMVSRAPEMMISPPADPAGQHPGTAG